MQCWLEKYATVVNRTRENIRNIFLLLVPVLTSLLVIHQLYHDYQTLLLGTSVNVCYWVPVLTSLSVYHQLYHDYHTY